jgi:hypothetical protein
LFGHLWEVELSYRYIFAFKFALTFKVSAAGYCSRYLPPVSTTLAKLVAKFATGVVDTGGAPLLAIISAHFRKSLKHS